MNAIEAAKKLKEGKKLCLPSWPHGEYIKYDNNNIVNSEGMIAWSNNPIKFCSHEWHEYNDNDKKVYFSEVNDGQKFIYTGQTWLKIKINDSVNAIVLNNGTRFDGGLFVPKDIVEIV